MACTNIVCLVRMMTTTQEPKTRPQRIFFFRNIMLHEEMACTCVHNDDNAGVASTPT